MSKTKINVVGIGCDFQNEADESRKLAIENLSGGEKDRVSWMTKFMVHNKAFKYTSSNKSEKDQKAYFEMTHSTVVRVDESAVNKDDLKKIFLSEVPTEMYPVIEKKFFEIVKSIGYPDIQLEKRINFKDLFEKNQK